MASQSQSSPPDVQCGDYPAIKDYAVIGDCRSTALISRGGSIDWLCLPHFSAPAVFAALLDRKQGGCFAVRPRGRFDSRRRYLPHTNVLETTFITDAGSVRLVDCMPIGGGDDDRYQGLNQPREVLRIVEGVSGEVAMEMVFEPRPDFGRSRPLLRDRAADGWLVEFGDERLILGGDVPLAAHGETGLRGSFSVGEGQRRYLSCIYTTDDACALLPTAEQAEHRRRQTEEWWRKWCAGGSYHGPYGEAVERSALTLKLLTCDLTGAIVAAATTSLPEAIGGKRNWDYRYCWIRDASLSLSAFAEMGHPGEDLAFLRWLLNSTRPTWPRLQIFYDVFGAAEQEERELPHLHGYCDSRPVRVGNAAASQRQLGIYGELISAVCDYVRRGGELRDDEARLLQGFGRVVCEDWRKTDQGIWEFRAKGHHHTHSKAMCWVALDRLIRMEEEGYLRPAPDDFRTERDRIRAAIEDDGYNRQAQTYVTTWGEDNVDASLLLLAQYGYKDADDPRMRATFERIEKELCENGFVYRYRQGLDDGLPTGENAFVIASFWAVEYLARAGQLERAVQRFEKVLSCANDVGLFAEQVVPANLEARGNFPQAFSHVGLINAAYALTEAGATP